MKQKPFKIICWFDYMASTGFATVSHNIVKALRRHYGDAMSMDIVAINYIEKNEAGQAIPGKVLKQDGGHTLIMPAIDEDAKTSAGEPMIDELGRHRFLTQVYNHDYDLIFIINDPGVVAGKKDRDGQVHGSVFSELKNNIDWRRNQGRKIPKIVYYFPIDGVPMPYWFDDFDVLSAAVAYTEYGRSMVLQTHPGLRKILRVIPHGVDTHKFSTLPNAQRDEFRKEYFGDNAGKTIFANINRNQTRKDIPTTIFGFELYQKTFNANSFLYLHMSDKDPQGWNLKWVLDQTDLVEGCDYMFQKLESRDIDVSMLNKIYNACDYYLTTTTGEGWGLTITEAMATGLPVIAPAHTSINEIGVPGSSKPRIYALEEFRPYCSHFDNMVRLGCIYEEVAEVMDKAVTAMDTALVVKNAFDYVQTLSWPNLTRRWIEIFDKLI